MHSSPANHLSTQDLTKSSAQGSAGQGHALQVTAGRVCRSQGSRAPPAEKAADLISVLCIYVAAESNCTCHTGALCLLPTGACPFPVWVAGSSSHSPTRGCPAVFSDTDLSKNGPMVVPLKRPIIAPIKMAAFPIARQLLPAVSGRDWARQQSSEGEGKPPLPPATLQISQGH